MKNKRNTWNLPSLLSLLTILSSCNLSMLEGGEGGIGQKWTSDGVQAEVDFRKLKVGSKQTIVFDLDDQTSCSCNLASSGSAASGVLHLSTCSASTEAGAVDCATIKDLYTFQAAGNALQICDSQGQCDSF